MAVALDHFLAKRAEQLAIVLLTRRVDIQVTQEPRDLHADLLVSLLENGQDVGQLLAVEVQAASSDETLLKTSRMFNRQSRFVTYFPFPMCLFVFSMETDQGYWRWIRQPEINSESKPHLVSIADNNLSPLTNQSVSQIVGTVREWYQQRLSPSKI